MKRSSKIFAGVLVLAVVLGGIGLLKYSGVLPGKMSPNRNVVGVYYCPMHPSYVSALPGHCPICNMTLVKRASTSQPAGAVPAGPKGTTPPKVFTVAELLQLKPQEICLLHKCKKGPCMMAMTEEFARLGQCPHCGEDLGIVIKDFLPQGYANVQLPPDKQQLIGVKTAPARKSPLVKTIRAAGRIAYDPMLYQAEAEFIQAVKARKKAESGSIPEMAEQALGMMDAARTKLRLMGLSDDLIRELETRGKPDQSLLYSKVGGTVWLYASIYEYEIPYVKVGGKVHVEIPALPGETVEGTVRSMDPVVDPTTRTVRIRAVLRNPEGFLKPEMYVNASLRADAGEGIVVPEGAVFATGEKNLVFVAKADGLFEPREVVLGIKADGVQEIKSGIGEGETVVTSGNFLIDSESRLRAALESAGGGMHQHG